MLSFPVLRISFTTPEVLAIAYLPQTQQKKTAYYPQAEEKHRSKVKTFLRAWCGLMPSQLVRLAKLVSSLTLA